MRRSIVLIAKTFLLFVLVILGGVCLFVLHGCSENDIAQMQYERESRTAKYQSEYAKSINQLEMQEGNFKTYRRVIFYNVRLGETVFCCEGYCHVQIDSDGDVELVVKTAPDQYYRHYLGQKADITYFSEQLKPVDNEAFSYRIRFNPKLWIPDNYETVTRY